MVSSGYIQENAKARERLRSSIMPLTDEELRLPLEEGWTISAALAHLAFWDHRALVLIRRWKEAGIGPSPIDVDGVNDAMQPLCLTISPRLAADLAAAAAESVDGEIERLPDALRAGLEELVKEGRFRLNRALHRNQHLGEMESVLTRHRRGSAA